MRRRREAPKGFLASFVASIALLVPAAWSLVENERIRSGRPAPSELLDRTMQALESTDRGERFRQLREELERTTGFDFEPFSRDPADPRWAAYPGEVLPLSDPSSRRSALWVILSGGHSPGTVAPVLFGGALVGAIEPGSLPGGIARVRTLLDTHFRVRFRADGVTGILRGTGQRGSDGRPLLEAVHVTPLGEIPSGTRVHAAGADGTFPAGILIGEWAGVDEGGSVPRVRAWLRPEDLSRVVVLSDAARAARDAAGGGR